MGLFESVRVFVTRNLKNLTLVTEKKSGLKTSKRVRRWIRWEVKLYLSNICKLYYYQPGKSVSNLISPPPYRS